MVTDTGAGRDARPSDCLYWSAIVIVSVLTVVCVIVVWILAAVSLLAVATSPVYALWKPAVAATEWGHWLAAFTLVFAAVAAGLGAGWPSLVPAAPAVLLFLTPGVRAFGSARRLRLFRHRLVAL
jgi:hypothetical protein